MVYVPYKICCMSTYILASHVHHYSLSVLLTDLQFSRKIRDRQYSIGYRSYAYIGDYTNIPSLVA